MDIGFHYYIIKLICLGLGMPVQHARVIAHASQLVDDNLYWRKIDSGQPSEFPIVATFSMDINKNKADCYTTLLMHFPPGDGSGIPGVEREDGLWFEGITTPGCKIAEEVLDRSIESRNLYQIGVSLHTFADTWAHQGFAGCEHPCNDVPSNNYSYYQFLPNVGHAKAMHNPDLPVVWEDKRLKSKICRINNKERFYEAASAIAKKLDRFINPDGMQEEREKRIHSVLEKIFKSFGEPIPSIDRKAHEIEDLTAAQIYNFRKLCLDEQFGGFFLDVYDRERWRDSAIHVKSRGLGFDDDKISDFFYGLASSPLKDSYHWQPTYFNNLKILYEPNNSSKTAKPQLRADRNHRFFETFPSQQSPLDMPTVIQDIMGTSYYNFHVAAQTILSHLVKRTEERAALDKKGEKMIPLYQYYNEDKQLTWVDQMHKRTLARRHEIYGDTD